MSYDITLNLAPLIQSSRHMNQQNNNSILQTTPKSQIKNTLSLTRPFLSSAKKCRSQPNLKDQIPIESLTCQSSQTQGKSQGKIDSSTWIKAYRKSFPNFIFYFDGIDQKTQKKLVQQVKSLGASVESFFSSKITHLITNNDIEAHSKFTTHSAMISPESRPNPSSSFEPPHLQSPTLSTRSFKHKPFNHELLQSPSHTPYPPKLFSPPSNRYSSVTSPLVSKQIVTPSSRNCMLNAAYQEKSLTEDYNLNLDIYSRAREWGIKIWSLDKLQNRILKNLLGNYASTSKDSSKRLVEVLHEEKVFGISTNRDEYNFSKEMATLKEHYLLVEDITGVHKPVMIAEFPKVKEGYDPPWPRLYPVPEGKCPFVRFVEGKDDKKKYFIDPKPQLNLLKTNDPVMVDSNASGMNQTTTVTSASISSQKTKMSNTTVPTNPKIKELELLGRRVPSTSRTKPSIITRSSKPKVPLKMPMTKKPGYCENCRIKYEDLNEHIKSRTHRRFATQSSNYTELDDLLAKLQRKPKPSSSSSNKKMKWSNEISFEDDIPDFFKEEYLFQEETFNQIPIGSLLNSPQALPLDDDDEDPFYFNSELSTF